VCVTICVIIRDYTLTLGLLSKAVTFLKQVKELVGDPHRMLLDL